MDDSLVDYGIAVKHAQETFANEVAIRSHDLNAMLDVLVIGLTSLQKDLESQCHVLVDINQDLNAVLGVGIHSFILPFPS